LWTKWSQEHQVWLHTSKGGLPRKVIRLFDYCRVVIGKLNNLRKCIRIDMTCASHQCARFVGSPRTYTQRQSNRLGDIWLGPKTKKLSWHRAKARVWSFVDASFVGNWHPKAADWDSERAKSRMG
jgi:hypothetical protein